MTCVTHEGTHDYLLLSANLANDGALGGGYQAALL